jgi:hypothetical protein
LFQSSVTATHPGGQDHQTWFLHSWPSLPAFIVGDFTLLFNLV